MNGFPGLIKNRFLLLALTAAAGLVQARLVAAQLFTAVHVFTGGIDGTGPVAGLIASSNTLYGTADGSPDGSTRNNGPFAKSTLFKVNTDGSGFVTLHTFTTTSGYWPFTNSDGALRGPNGGLVLSGNTLYGTAASGGLWGWGTVFRVNTDGSGFTNLHHFTDPNSGVIDGSTPSAGLALSDDTLYGTTVWGGSLGAGTIFKISTNGTGFAILHSFSNGSDGGGPDAGLILAGNTLYGTAQCFALTSDYGTVFKINTDGTGFTVLHTFTPETDPSSAGYLTNSDGAYPAGKLILSGNTLYGTTSSGGPWGSGTVFRVNTDGSGFTNLHSFAAIDARTSTNSDGSFSAAGLVIMSNTLYGTATEGGSAGQGTVFQLNTDGSGFEVLRHFTGGPNGGGPGNGLVSVSNLLYGTAEYGGGLSNGIVFSLIPVAPPVITTQPLSRTNIAGSIATFSVGAGGTAPLSYQWLKGGSPLPQQQSSTLTLVKVSDADAAAYSVVVTNAAGSVTSASVRLTVIDRPQLKVLASATKVVLTWPASAAGFTLQFTTNLAPPVKWTAIPPVPVVVNGQDTVTNSVSGKQQFFRLSQ